jgi:hypothetical protein
MKLNYILRIYLPLEDTLDKFKLRFRRIYSHVKFDVLHKYKKKKVILIYLFFPRERSL